LLVAATQRAMSQTGFQIFSDRVVCFLSMIPKSEYLVWAFSGEVEAGPTQENAS
jgi:hypothetical protein